MIHTWCFNADNDVVQTSVESRGVDLQGAGYDVRSRFARGGISAAADTVVCFGLTADSTEAERAELIAIILNVTATMHHIFRCIHNIRRIDQWKIGAWVRDKLKKRRRRRASRTIPESVFYCLKVPWHENLPLWGFLTLIWGPLVCLSSPSG